MNSLKFLEHFTSSWVSLKELLEEVIISVAGTTAEPLTAMAHNDESARRSRIRDLSIDYLRTTLTVVVIAHHSTLAYTTWAHFDTVHVLRSTAPIVDSARWIFFDYAENFNDVFSCR